MISNKSASVLLVLASAFLFSLAGIFVKGVTADTWTIVFWRSLFAALFLITVIGHQRSIRTELFAIGGPGLLASIVGASGILTFVAAFKFIPVANVSFIYATAPLVTALIAWAWLRENPQLKTILASCLAISGVAIIFVSSLGQGSLQGNLLALLMTIAASLYICIYRRYPNTPAIGPIFIQSLILIPVAACFVNPFAANFYEIFIMALFGIAFAIAIGCLALGSRRLQPSETSLLSSVETPLAPLLAFLVLSELPSQSTFYGGLVVVAAVIASQITFQTTRGQSMVKI
ncbi:MAG: DMT family transporter [Gammaproteobacteria bacterium]